MDPLTDLAHLVKPFRDDGITLVAVHSGDLDPDKFSQLGDRDAHFNHSITLVGQDYSELRSLVKETRLLAIVPGCEFCVELCDDLCAEFAPAFGNNTDTSHWRYDKSEMQHALNLHGDNFISSRCIDPESWQESIIEELGFPVFVRPAYGSMGSMYSSKCVDLASFRRVCADYHKHDSLFPQKSPLLVQPYMQGREFVVDTASCNGAHKIVGVYEYCSEEFKGIPLVRSIDSVSTNNSAAMVCIRFVLSVLDALELRNGVAHVELMLTASGPYLIELNARLSGAFGALNLMSAEINQRSQTRLLYEAIVNPQKFTSYPQVPDSHGHARILTLYVRNSRRVKKVDEDKLKYLESYRFQIQCTHGFANFPPQCQMYDTVSLVIMFNTDERQLNMDCAQVFELEEQELLF